MKLSDYVADFLARQGIRHVFIISGGASIHLLHSIAAHPDIEHVCPHHEQAGAFAADAYARVTGMGCAIGTSGPGATNLITGIAGCWYDSVPCLFITGQVASFRSSAGTGVRQMGFQETPIVDMVRPITKWAETLNRPQDIRHYLEYAMFIARRGRPGPVVIDIPDDFQRAEIDPETLRSYVHPVYLTKWEATAVDVSGVLELMATSERPVLILGSGSPRDMAVDLVDTLGIPTLLSWGARDYLPQDHRLNAGTFGTHGTRAGNFTVQNADFILSIGARLSTRETGALPTFARGAKLVVVDIDRAELDKFEKYGRPLFLGIHADAQMFVKAIGNAEGSILLKPSDWWSQTTKWRAAYPPPDTFPYRFIAALSDAMPEDEHVFIDTGCAIAWMMQAFQVKRQRLFHDFNNTAMGWALPAAIGGCLALGRKPVTCIVGDGSLMMNLQELATIRHHNLPIRIIVLNNGGYGMVRQTEEQWLGGKHVGTDEGDLSFPAFGALANAFGVADLCIDDPAETKELLRRLYRRRDSTLCEVHFLKKDCVEPQARYGRPIEDAEPLLPREEFMRQMIVPVLDVSRGME